MEAECITKIRRQLDIDHGETKKCFDNLKKSGLIEVLEGNIVVYKTTDLGVALMASIKMTYPSLVSTDMVFLMF